MFQKCGPGATCNGQAGRLPSLTPNLHLFGNHQRQGDFLCVCFFGGWFVGVFFVYILFFIWWFLDGFLAIEGFGMVLGGCLGVFVWIVFGRFFAVWFWCGFWRVRRLLMSFGWFSVEVVVNLSVLAKNGR